MATKKTKPLVEVVERVSVKRQSKIKKRAEELANDVWPKITRGSHLTVNTFEDGRTELIWDDEALTREVRDAIIKYEVEANSWPFEQQENDNGNSKASKQSKRQTGKSK